MSGAAGFLAVERAWLAFALNAVGFVACGAFVRVCGRRVVRREFGRAHPVPANVVDRGLRLAARLILPPLLVGTWILAFTAGILVLAPTFDVVATALASLGIAVTVRAAAQYSEGFAETLATMLPFALLGLAVLDGVVTRSLSTVVDVLDRLLAHWPIAVYGLVALVLVDLAFRAVGLAVRTVRDAG
ncbi:hypothetical protein [Haloplanus aerogenes]|uniref:Uncharacterized protein n=1 Tax=Haloplanus aerogenes TaxID=660522 RepID=A0A3M0DRY4_9EURY|nr:hypothetical protein [Haloplanus aerogenes]AZH24186.1 hypothetical protein DU502_01810 [Haloplanus aerogenes]RMB24194.1 hypothetical protein ATH50_1434 [Haloplanus aerogenes]